ncbi:hypothetical protein SAMN04487911_1039 [Arenibacter nanhaiticus]|uniref:Uncharacterized protein n=1 Tax=Arenibacter nanhaiticus TaxID=558155 RepID=A0A1M6BX86_9FLAO|nr:hypothetical protein SAMN04487911_1039 [Arenibacter nanhaiticus]
MFELKNLLKLYVTGEESKQKRVDGTKSGVSNSGFIVGGVYK